MGTSGRNWAGSTFRDAGAFLEQWTHEDTHDLRRGEYGPAWYKNIDGVWQQSVDTRFSSYYLPERLEKEQVRCDFVSAGVHLNRPHMATGGLTKPDDAAARNPRDLDQLVVATALPGALTSFESNAEELLREAEATTPEPVSAPVPAPTPDPTPTPTAAPTSAPTAEPTPSPPAPDPTTEVSCGGHKAPKCADCPAGNGAAWCNGDCHWLNGACVADTPSSVSCGGHRAVSCAACPHGNGRWWCNGDCKWSWWWWTCVDK